jgi:ornithine cyclodeaminase/alanine dehydrogenase
MAQHSFLVLRRAEIENLISLADAIRVVEEALVDFGKGKGFLFPVIRERIDPYGGFFGVKAGYLASRGCLGYKGGGFWAANRERGLAGHQSVIVLYDPETGRPSALMDGNYLTIIRTGAVGAIAARYLARPDSRRVAIIGAGAQGRIQLAALREVLPVVEVRCFDLDSQCSQGLAGLASREGLRAMACVTTQEAVEGADVIVTATPSLAPIIRDEWIQPGMHINAFGADTKGKHEIDPKVLVRAKVVVDYWPQAREIGECQHPFGSGLIRSVHAELAEVAAGRKPGRESGTEITLFDATGIALEDLAVAMFAFEAAVERGMGLQVPLG